MINKDLEKYLNNELKPNLFHDYCPNGLQIEGRKEVKKIVTGVTACQALLDAAVSLKADAIIVHHGYFWKNESPVITGMKYQRIKTLLTHDINLYAYHLPLDAHFLLGNNAQIAKRLMIHTQINEDNTNLLSQGELTSALTPAAFQEQLEQVFQHAILHCGDTAPSTIKRVAWTSGGGQSYIEQAADLGVDAFISGEVSEKTIHVAREMGIHFFAAGHHATERFGIQALGEWLRKVHELDVTYVDIDNPA